MNREPSGSAGVHAGGPLDVIDAGTAERLLSAALESGGDYADLYFEYRSGAGYSFEEGLVVGSDGRMGRDRQPMVRFGVHAVAEENGKRQGGRSGGAARRGMEQFERAGQSPTEHGREAARLALAMLHAKDAPAGPMEVVLGPGESGILLHEAVGHGLEADFNRK